MIKTIMFKDIQLQKIISFKSASYSSKTINGHGNKSPIEDEEIIIIGTNPEISTSFPPIGINIVIPNLFSSERRLDHNWKSSGQRNSYYYQKKSATDLSYYQPQPAKYNQRQKYFQYRRTQQDFSKNDYDGYKSGKT